MNLLSNIVAQLALAAIYFGSAKLGLMLALEHHSASVVWPPTGIALTAVLLLGRRVWPAILVGALLANLTTSESLLTCIGIATGNTLEALVGAWLVERFAGGRFAFEHAPDVFRFAILAGLCSTAISATIGVGSLALAGSVTPNAFGSVWLTWWLGDASSNLIIAPLLLTWIRLPLPRLDASQLFEAAALLVTVLVVGLAAVGGAFPAQIRNTPLHYLGLIPLIWAAVRFGPRGAAAAVCMLAGIAVVCTVSGLGPFLRNEPHESLLLLQAFMATMSLTALVLAAVVLESRRTHAALRRAGEEARAAGNAKDRFIAVLSHELRTPLTPVLASLSEMESDPALRGHRTDLDMIRRNVELEARLIDDLLDLNRITRGKLELRLEDVDAHAVLEEALQLGRAHQNGHISLSTDLRASNHWVRADHARLGQVFRNLVGNALKFMPEGGALTVRTANPTPDRLSVQVSDTGIGMAPQMIPRLFEPFEQGACETTLGGLGIGLAISRTIVEALSGTIDAHSDGLGRGATFRVTLPTVTAPASTPVSEVSPGTRRPPKGRLRILLVEDHADTARALQRVLERTGHSVSSAHTVADATRRADEHAFDLVISDVGLPDGTGLDLMRRLRTRHALRGIALTGYGMEQDIIDSRAAGFAEHLTKPIDPRRLEAAIQRILSRS